MFLAAVCAGTDESATLQHNQRVQKVATQASTHKLAYVAPISSNDVLLEQGDVLTLKVKCMPSRLFIHTCIPAYLAVDRCCSMA